MNNLEVIGGTSNPLLVEKICHYIGKSPCNIVVSHFPDGETMVQIKDDIRGKNCFIVQSTCPPVNDNLVELLITIDCLKRASANSITVVLPYFGYARQDRKTGGRTPITAKMVSDLLTGIGVDRVLTVDLHAKQIEGFFNLPVDHLSAFPVFINSLKERDLTNYVVLSPDVGNMKMGEQYAIALGLKISTVHKRRIDAERVEATTIIGDVRDKKVLMFDDMISTAGTMCMAADLAVKKGAISVEAVATHGLFCGGAIEKLSNSKISQIIVSDTIPLSRAISDKIKSEKSENFPEIGIISLAKLIGEAIIRIHSDRSVSALLKDDYGSIL